MRKIGIALIVVPVVVLLLHYGAAFLGADRCRKSELVYDYLQGICFGQDDYLPYTTYGSAYGWLLWLVAVSITLGLVVLARPLWRSHPLLNHVYRTVRKYEDLWLELVASVLLFLFGAFFALIGIGGSGNESWLGTAVAGAIFLVLGVWLFCRVLLEWRRRRRLELQDRPLV